MARRSFVAQAVALSNKAPSGKHEQAKTWSDTLILELM
jgi:hypothetical protein